MSVSLYIKDILVKQFSDKEEEIVINRKLKDYRDIEKIFGDYTESFTVPANANNEIFKHYYDADIEGGFDARIKQDAYIELNGELWKRGEVQLIDVEIKDNRPEAYKIQFFGEVTQLVDLFGEDELNDLDYSDLIYDYTYSNIKQGLQTGLFSGQIIYPLISYKRRFLYNTAVTGLDPELNVDIAKGGVSDFEGINWRELKPAIKVSTIFQKIQDYYGLTFQGDIFSDTRFNEIYMNLVNQKETQGESTKVILDTFLIFSGVVGNNADLANITTDITPNTAFQNVPYGIRYFVDNQLVLDTGLTNEGNVTEGYQIINESQGSTEEEEDILYRIEVYANQAFTFDWEVEVRFIDYTTPSSDIIDTYSNTNEVLSITISVNQVFQEFKITDFIKAFVRAFNLVLIPINSTTIFFQSLQPFYADGRIIDITKYVKTDKLRVATGELVSGLDMKYEKTDTFLSAVFEENNNRSFGELDIDFRDSNGRVFNGKRISVQLPFEKFVFEKLGDATNDLTYGYAVNREQEEFNPFHSIFYSKIQTSSIFLKDDIDTAEEIISFNQPRTSYANGFALNFENEIDEYTREVLSDNFYTRYYADYVDDLFSPKRRQYNLEARLPKFISQGIKLNDRLLIGQRIYLINSLQHNLTTDVIKFELLNDIFTGAESINQIIDVEDKFFLIEKQTITLTTNKVGSANIISVVSNNVFVMPSYSGGQISLDVSENTTGETRNAVITVTFDDEDSTQILIKVIQNG